MIYMLIFLTASSKNQHFQGPECEMTKNSELTEGMCSYHFESKTCLQDNILSLAIQGTGLFQVAGCFIEVLIQFYYC